MTPLVIPRRDLAKYSLLAGLTALTARESTVAYTKQTWANGPDGLTPISADRLNFMEDGISGAAPVSAIKPSGDTSVALLEWTQDSATGYLMHLTCGVNSTSAASVLAIGTELGSANGLLISHKNAGIGMNLGVQPGAGSGIQIAHRSASGFPLRVLFRKNSLPVSLRAEGGEGFKDGVTTSGSTTLTSATANFDSADVGRTILQLTSIGTASPLGSIPASTTIASVTSSTQVVLSNAAGASSAGLMFEILGRPIADDQTLLSVQDNVSATYTTLSKQGLNVKGSNVAFPPLRVLRVSGQTSPIFEARSESGTLLSYIGRSGHLTTAVQTAATTSDISAGSVTLHFDATAGAAKLKIVGRNASGTIVNGEVALS